MEPITKQQVEDYLKEKHKIKDPEDLFTKSFKDTRFEIINDVSKHFASSWIENGILQSDDPETLLRITYHNYNNFDHITDISILTENLNKMVEYRDKNMADMRRQIEAIKEMDNKQERDR